MATFPFELVAPERVLFSGSVESVVVPGTDGQFQVFAGHAPLMTTLQPGIVTVDAGGSAKRLFVLGGFADVSPAGLSILAERAIPLDEVDPQQLARDIADAQSDVSDAKTDEVRVAAQSKLDGLLALRAAIAN